MSVLQRTPSEEKDNHKGEKRFASHMSVKTPVARIKNIYNSMRACSVMPSCSVVFDSATPWTVAYQAPLSLGFFRQEYWSGLPFAQRI